jgi:hypothetical protein
MLYYVLYRRKVFGAGHPKGPTPKISIFGVGCPYTAITYDYSYQLY